MEVDLENVKHVISNIPNGIAFFEKLNIDDTQVILKLFNNSFQELFADNKLNIGDFSDFFDIKMPIGNADDLLLESLVNQRSEEFEYFNKINSIWYKVHILPFNSLSFFIFITDITKEKETSLKFLLTNSILTYLLDSIDDTVYYKDTNGVYIGCNPLFAEFCGRNREDIIGKTDFDIFDHEVAELLKKSDAYIFDSLESIEKEEILVYPDGTRKKARTYKTPFLDKKGNILGVIGISRILEVYERVQTKLARDMESPVIIVAEDMQVNRFLIVSMIKSFFPKAEVIEAQNGMEVVTRVRGKEQIDLVFMDLQMPIMNGVEATKIIRAYEKQEVVHSHLPIIALTAFADASVKEKCINSGMDDVVYKPVNSSKIENVLRKFISRGSYESSSLETYSKENKENLELEIKKLHFDKDALFSKVSGDKVLYKTIINSALDQFDSVISSFKKAVETSDIDSIKEFLHTIKGTAAELCLQYLTTQVRDIQKKILDGSYDYDDDILDLEKEWEFIKEIFEKELNE